MDIKTFLHNLHFDIDAVHPPNWEVDWDDAPLPYKLYRGRTEVNLSSEVPFTLPDSVAALGEPGLRSIGHFLWYTYGVAQLTKSYFPLEGSDELASFTYAYRRFVPSGGGLYPSEIYVYLKLSDLPHGVYHYNAAHHRLVLLREGNFDAYLETALGSRCKMDQCFGALFISTVFWKNYFKYNNFAYRLQGLDAGVLMGQCLETAKRFDFAAGVYFQFLDKSLNHLLGLSMRDETVYSVIALSTDKTMEWFTVEQSRDWVTDSDLCKTLPELCYTVVERSQRVKPYPMIEELARAATYTSTESFTRLAPCKTHDARGQSWPLPSVETHDYDFAAVVKERYSPGMDFIQRAVSLNELAALFLTVTRSFGCPNDLKEEQQERILSRVQIYVCCKGVEDLSDGAYGYNPFTHALENIREGDYRDVLQAGMSMHNVNLFQVPLCIHLAGANTHYMPVLGVRGYRIQQMETGMALQRLLLACGSLGLQGHPLLGFEVAPCDELYELRSSNETCLIQVPVGYVRKGGRLQGSLHA